MRDSVTIYIDAGDAEPHKIVVFGSVGRDTGFSPDAAYIGDHQDDVWFLLSEGWDLEGRAIAEWERLEAERRREGDVDGEIDHRKLEAA